jgi:deoxyribodipyrimidine photolyase-related protein
MLAGQPYLYHSRLSCVLNLHLLDPREAISAAVEAHARGAAPLNSVEGFLRQILGWREFVRGIYWREMPGYADMNALKADLEMPAFMWTGETDMACVRHAVRQLVDHAYAHHIQRLMVLGLVSLLLGVRPYEVHRWHMSMYADAVDWVSLPNVLGMSQFGDGGIVGSKPYAASGNYIRRMSDYCAGCRFDPAKAVGEDACPFTTLYWDFLSRHRAGLRGLRHMGYQLGNLDRKDDGERRAIRRRAAKLKSDLAAETYL